MFTMQNHRRKRRRRRRSRRRRRGKDFSACMYIHIIYDMHVCIYILYTICMYVYTYYIQHACMYITYVKITRERVLVRMCA
jgi:hypothetical protein